MAGIDPSSKRHAITFIGLDNGTGPLILYVDNTVDDLLWFLEWLLELRAKSRLLAFVEDQYLGRNVKSMITLVRGRSRIELIMEAAGFEVQLVSAQTWQSAMLRTKRGDARAVRKQAAKVLARTLTGAPATMFSEDMADSFCIAVWGEGEAEKI